MYDLYDFSGIPNLPDLTHAEELIAFGSNAIKLSLIFAIALLGLGITVALFTWSSQKTGVNPQSYLVWVVGFPHVVLVFAILIGGFFINSTLANRYHHWEQQKISEVATQVHGERLEQLAPRMRYQVEESYTQYNWVDGEQVATEATRIVDRFVAISGSDIEVKINQTQDPGNSKWIYSADFVGQYEVTNNLNDISQFYFDIQPPYGYSLLQNFQVQQGGENLNPTTPGNYSFPFNLASGETTTFQVNYQAQGSPRWVYQASGQLLSNFRLNAIANFPDAEFAGAIPTITTEKPQQREMTWIFEGNVSVRNPFGVFTATTAINNTGILPRLLLLSPGIFLWWILLLYLSIPLGLKDVAIAAGVFFASVLMLTYGSRLINPIIAWTFISAIWLGLVWGLGSNRWMASAAIVCTITGGILPILGLLVPYSGLTLGIAGLLSVTWLAVRHWYGISAPHKKPLREL